MWFRNLQILRFDPATALEVDAFSQQLHNESFQPCTSLARESRGWIPPRGDDRLVCATHGQWLLALGVEQKLLPASVVRQTVEARAAELERRMGVKPGRKRLRELKDEVTDELLPRAFSRYRTTFAWIDPAHGWLVIDAASPKKSGEFLEVLRKSLDEFPFAPLETKRSPAAAMTEWLAAGDAPSGFSIDRDCELQSPLEERATVRYANHVLTDTAEIRNHIAAGKVPTKLALTWRDRLSFLLTDKLEVKRLKLVDVTTTENDGEADDAEERFEADFVLMSGLLDRFLSELAEAIDP
jgi:recombination associated protein RdgC